MANAPELNQDFVDLLGALLEEEADFLVVGAHALAVHGVVRSTGDLDVLVRPEPANADRVVRALLRFGAPLSSHSVTADDFATVGTIYQLGLPPHRIDVLTRISGVDYDEAADDSIVAIVSGLELRFPNRAVLLRNKRASGRPKDLEDARLLEELAEAD